MVYTCYAYSYSMPEHPKPQMSSCFLLTMKEDSIEGIYDTLKQTAKISQSAGGIGLSYS